MATAALNNITKVYDNGFKAVSDLSIELDDGEFLVLVGPSGCGKSTALRMIAGLEEISEGELYVGDRLLNDVEPKNRDIAMVFQNYALYPQMTVAQNIEFPLKLRGINRIERNKQVKQAATVLELTEQLHKKPRQLSGGQRQRVAMGRAIVRQPSLFLMDEPLSNLDAKLRVQMRADIASIQQKLGVTTFYVTHDQVEAMTMGHRVAVIKDGLLQQVAAPESLYANPKNVFVAAFIGSPSMNLFEATLVGTEGKHFLQLGDQMLALPTVLTQNNPKLLESLDTTVIVGFRPEDLDDAAVFSDHPSDQQLVSTVSGREALGAETLIHFFIDAPPVDSGDPDVIEELGSNSSGRCTARFDPRSQAKLGDQIRVNINVDNLHFFNRQTHLAISS